MSKIYIILNKKYILVLINKIQALKSVFGLPISVSQTSLPGGMGGVKVKPQHSDLVAGHSSGATQITNTQACPQHTEEQDEGS